MNAPCQNIKQNVDLISLPGKTIYLVGTAHISEASATLVEETIREIKPDSVAVELCQSRYQSLENPDRWRNTDIITIIKQGKTFLLMSQLMLSAFQKKIGKQLGVKPGLEMMRAVALAKELEIKTILADRDVRTTLKRTWAAMGLWSIFKLLTIMIGGLFTKQEISEEEIEKLKHSDALEAMMQELSDALPGVRQALIDERDRYLAKKIAESPGDKVVAVVGAGHVPGIKRYIDQEIDLTELETLPAKGLTGRLIGWSIPVLVLGLFVVGFFTAGSHASLEMVKAWAMATIFFTAIGSVLALPHPLALLSGALSAPFTSVHPFLASGWVAGLVEALLRRPRVSDLETITDDICTIRGFWQNRVSKIFLVIAFTNLGTTAGMAVGIPLIVTWLS